MPAPLKQTPCAAAELRPRCTVRPFPSGGLRGATCAPFPCRWWTPPLSKHGAARRTTRQARSGIEPVRAWQALRENSACGRIHMTGFARTPCVRAQNALLAGHACDPRYVVLRLRSCAGIGSAYQAHARQYRSACGHGFAVAAVIEVRRLALRVEGTPAHPAIQPRWVVPLAHYGRLGRVQLQLPG
jgi:hypothetical protein